MCDLFYIIKETDFASYVDNNTPYICPGNTRIVIEKLEAFPKCLLEWFENNAMKANAEKYNPLLSDMKILVLQ